MWVFVNMVDSITKYILHKSYNINPSFLPPLFRYVLTPKPHVNTFHRSRKKVFTYLYVHVCWQSSLTTLRYCDATGDHCPGLVLLQLPAWARYRKLATTSTTPSQKVAFPPHLLWSRAYNLLWTPWRLYGAYKRANVAQNTYDKVEELAHTPDLATLNSTL